jgi:excisionase family DNA binding protein
MDTDLLTVSDAARVIGVSAAYLRRLGDRGRIRQVRVGTRGIRLFARVSVVNFAAARQARQQGKR